VVHVRTVTVVSLDGLSSTLRYVIQQRTNESVVFVPDLTFFLVALSSIMP